MSAEFFSPNDFTVEKLIAVLERYSRAGYEIVALFVDYVALLVEGKGGDNTQLAIETAIEKLRGYTFPKAITVFSAHQLNSKAVELAPLAGNWFVTSLPGAGFYKQCHTLNTKLDSEMFCHIIELKGRKFLTICTGKWRDSDVVSPERKRFAYELHPNGSLLSEEFGGKAIYDLGTIQENKIEEEFGPADDDCFL